LEASFAMYDLVASQVEDGEVDSIPPDIQDEVARRQADGFILKEFDKLTEDEECDPLLLDKTARLRNVLLALGGTFRQILLSDAAERRVFSFAFSDGPTPDVLDVLNLGVSYG